MQGRFCWLQARSPEPKTAHSSKMFMSKMKLEMHLCVYSQKQHADFWRRTKQNQGDLMKGNLGPWKQWHGSCRIPKQPSYKGYWAQNPCEAKHIPDLNKEK